MSARAVDKNEAVVFALFQTALNQRDSTDNMDVEPWPWWFTFPERVRLILMEPSIWAAINSSLHEVVPLLAAFLRWSTLPSNLNSINVSGDIYDTRTLLAWHGCKVYVQTSQALSN